jgi:ferric-dicitrate binding protein FerR (iron transport regulator)
MTPERFRVLVDAYGSDPHRWPEDERAASMAWAKQHRDEADAILASASELDDWLESYVVATPGRDLRRRIVSGAPQARPTPGRRTWWPGLALAGAGLTGGLVGALAVSLFVLAGSSHIATEAAYQSTTFSGSDFDWSSE